MLQDAEVWMPWFAGVLGAIVGSFLNVLIHRLPRDELSVLRPRRSFCPTCTRQLRWYDNLPILSWIFLGGRCSGCKSPIPVRYLLVECLTAVGFAAWTVLLLSRAKPLHGEDLAVLAIGWYLVATSIVVTFIDFEFKIIPDEITISGMVLGVLLSVAVPTLHQDSWLHLRLAGDAGWETHLSALVTSLSGLAVGAGMVMGVGKLGELAFRKEAMGFGDVKYMGMVGAFLGMDGVVEVFLLACVFGSLVGLLLRAITGSQYIAFGPYLALGVLLVLSFRLEIVELWFVTLPSILRRVMGLGGA